ncbi:hypothetical protein [Bradyrhizobium elkanii]|uniref:hypothetical protein n=1 Tax=Bradyrhizobium elkanii TaxID=29448 RepID=UPI000841F7B2|nr:hypothetical protein [Bradyrhizobium elkanii]ODM77815.1 hypothetical protein A6452_34635 [Bradyrhizobium elkanii]ODM81729.1 hypothetical protein A6X20_18880 [Bradyrhizobium elkanii]
MNEIRLAYDAAALQGVFNNAAIALAIVGLVLLALWAAEYKLRELLGLVIWSTLAIAAIGVGAWLCIGVWWGLI